MMAVFHLQALKDCVVRKIRAVTVLPVRDLASQVYGVFRTYCQGTNVKVGSILKLEQINSLCL